MVRIIGILACCVFVTSNDHCAIGGTIVVDYSPVAVIGSGGSIGSYGYGNTFDNQILGDEFTWQGGNLTGASIFSKSTLGAVGDAVRVVVLRELGFGETPVIDITTTIDLVDSQFSTVGATRKHATITPAFLGTGNYYFYMTGAVRGLNIGQGTGFYDDGIVYVDTDGDPGIADTTGVGVGDLLFQLEGDVSAVPEPSSLSLLGVGGLTLFGCQFRRKRKTALTA